ncbi:recombinase zinc beta ribbon domain-containing protein [Patescibacteria group bacterium]|nr:recombinase zinc beta ribbon domain-containing protein [Patescibacteria group bacterium]
MQAEAEVLGLTGKHKKVLQTSTIYRIITNPFYYGKYEWPKNSGNWYKGKHKPIITFTEYQQVQEIMAKSAKPKKSKLKEVKDTQILEQKNQNKLNKLNLPVIYKGLMTCKVCGGAITASKVRKQQKNGNKHQYIYYHCSKRKDKNCNQKSYPVNQEALEPQVLKFLEEITIVPEVYEWAMSQSKLRKTNDQDFKEKVLQTHKQNLERSKNKIQNLIDMLADNDISREEYQERRKKCEDETNVANEAILNIEGKEKRQQEMLTDTFQLVTNLKKKFQKGTPDKKKEIILKLGSNLSLKDKKLAIMLDLKFQAFQKHANGANQEITRIKPLEMPINTTQNTLTRGAYATMSE